MIDWKKTSEELPDEGVLVKTKIDDHDGCRIDAPAS